MNPARDPRYEVEIQVHCLALEVFASNYMTNISRGGMFIRTERPWPVDTKVHLRFRLPQTDLTVEPTGRVVWNYDIPKGATRLVSGAGLQFVDMSEADQEAIERYLDRLAESPPPSFGGG